MKSIIKRIPFIRTLLKYRIFFNHFIELLVDSIYDFKRYYKHSSLIKIDTQDKLIANIIANYHVIEKGFSMPLNRKDFGKDFALNLHNQIKQYYNLNYSLNSSQFIVSIQVLKKYISMRKEGYLDTAFLGDTSFIENFATVSYDLKKLSKDDMLKMSKKPFNEFAPSRYTIRDFSSEPVNLNKIYNAIKISQKSPSVCNRQSTKIMIIKNSELKKQILNVQQGNRGFGHHADLLLVITCSLESFFGSNERNQCFIDGGIFLMSLLYALHYEELGAATLNWAVRSKTDTKLKKLLNMSDSEVVMAILAVGNLKDEFNVAVSNRKNLDEIIQIV